MIHANSQRDTVTSVTHWLIAVVMIGMLIFGFYLRYFVSIEANEALVALHRQIGFLVLVPASGSIIWRMSQGRLPNAKLQSGWMRVLVAAVHWSLLAATMAIPLSGLAMTLGHGGAIDLFGVFKVGPLAEPNHTLAQLGSVLHAKLGKVLALAIALHIAGAVKHHFYLAAAWIRTTLQMSASS